MTTKNKRAFATHTPRWQRFQTARSVSTSTKAADSTTHAYQRQYSHVYAQRLVMLKERCLQAVPEGSNVVDRVLDLREDVPSVLVGTLVQESSDGKALGDNTRCKDGDVMALEDESGRVTLELPKIHELCTGMIIAVEGVVGDKGVLHADRVYLPKQAPQPKITGELRPSTSGHGPCLMLLSGLDCGNPDTSTLKRDMLLAYLEGRMTASASKVCRVVVCGGSVFPGEMAFGTKELDGFLAQICAAGIPIDLMPGEDDPTTANWPQRPIHSSLLQHADTFNHGLLSRTPNPYAAGLGDKLVIGTDGKNVQDMTGCLWNEGGHVTDSDKKDAKMDDTTEREDVNSVDAGPFSETQVLEHILQCCHLCPTGPDSVPTVPHIETDPMVLQHTPHLLFGGGCNSFSTSMVGTTRTLCIPSFSKTGEAVLVDLATMNCELLRFDDSL